MRESGESVGFMEQSGINHTVSPLGRVGWEQMRSCAEQLGTDRESDQALPARGRFERLFEQQKDFQVWRGESGQY